MHEKNTYVFPFGADVPKKIKKAAVPDYKRNELKLLFSGKDWDIKGGDIAVDVAEYLNKIGIKTELYIVGIKQLSTKMFQLQVEEYMKTLQVGKHGQFILRNLLMPIMQSK